MLVEKRLAKNTGAVESDVGASDILDPEIPGAQRKARVPQDHAHPNMVRHVGLA